MTVKPTQEYILQTIRAGGQFSETKQALLGRKWTGGEQIYQIVIDIGALPNATQKTVAHGESPTFVIPGGLYGIADNGSPGTILPLPKSDVDALANGIELSADATNVYVKSGLDYSSYSGYVVMEFIE